MRPSLILLLRIPNVPSSFRKGLGRVWGERINTMLSNRRSKPHLLSNLRGLHVLIGRGIDKHRDRLPFSHPLNRAIGDLATNLLVTDEPPYDSEDDLETDEGGGHEEEA